MIALILTCLSALAHPLVEAAEAELGRTLGLRMADQPPPYFVGYEMLDGEVTTVHASMGQVTSFDEGPYRDLRVDVRVGSPAMDNTNFEVDFGEREGVQVRGLPHEDDITALRREIWLASDSAYKGAAEQYAAKVAARQGRVGEQPPDRLAAPPLSTPELPRPEVDGQALQRRIQALSARMAGLPWLEGGEAIGRDWQGLRVLVNSEQTRAFIPTGFTVVAVEAIARAEDGSRLRDLRWWVARSADQLPPESEMLAEVDQMLAWLEALRRAPVETDYLGPVLFEQPAAIEFFRQLLHPELSGTRPPEVPPDPYAEDVPATPKGPRLGRRLLPEGWTVVDDPSALPGAAGAYAHDFEGVAASRVELVVDGVLRSFLMSRIPRAKADERSTGHGRGLGAERRQAMPAVVQVEPKRARSERRLERKALSLARDAGLPYVLVVGRMEPLSLVEDFEVAFSGEGPLAGLTRPTEAWRLYPDGRKEPVRGLGFVGVDRRALRDVAMAGEVGPPVDMMDAGEGSRRYSIGAVGGLPVTWQAPPVLITELELHGASGGEPHSYPAP